MASQNGVPARAAARYLAKYTEMPLLGKKTLLRPVLRSDLPRLALWDRDDEITALMGHKFAGLDGDVETWYRRVLTDRRLRALGIETLDGKLIGEVELDRIDWRTRAGELRILIGDRVYRGAGYGRDALLTFLRLAFGRWRFRTIYLRVYRHNTRAVRLYRSLGFVPVGVLSPAARRDDAGEILLMSLSRHRFLQLTGEDPGTERQEH